MNTHILGGLAAALALCATTSFASPIRYTVNGIATGCGQTGSSYGENVGSPTGAISGQTQNANPGSCQASSAAAAGQGYSSLGLFANSTSHDGQVSGNARSYASFMINSDTQYVGMIANFELDAMLDAAVFATTLSSEYASSGVSGYLRLQFATTGGAYTQRQFQFNERISVSADKNAPEDSDSLAIHRDYQVGDAQNGIYEIVDTTKELYIDFYISGNALYSGSSNGIYASQSEVGMDATNTLSFAVDAFQFDTAGAYVTDEGLGIVNNTWIDPRGATTPPTPGASVVPLPATGLLLIGGFGALAATRRRKAA